MTLNRQTFEIRHRRGSAAFRRLLAGSALAAAVAASSAVSAQEAAEGGEGDAIVVSGYRYLSEDTSGTTGLPVAIEDVPQSISLVSEDFLDATDARTLGDVAQYTPGALFDGNPGGTSSIV